MGVVRHLESVATYPELRAAFNAAQPEVSAFYTGIPLDAGLWSNIKAYAATPEAAQLTGARRRFLHKTIETFRRHGADLDPAGKKRLEEIDVELTQITTKFAENVLDSTNAFELVLTNEADLAGLPPTAIASARESAQRKGLEGWRFTLQAPDYFAVMTYLDDSAIRRKVYEAFAVRAASGDRDNRPLIARILELRREKAALLGFANFADLVLEDRMAHTGDRALAFLEDLKAKTEHRFREENQELLEFRRSLEGPDAPALDPWDVAYYAEKQRTRALRFRRGGAAPLLPHGARGGADSSSWCTASTASAWKRNPACRPGIPACTITMSATRTASFWAAFYADWHPRENKRGGAWMDGLITGGPAADGFRPHLGLICGNLTPPVGGKPALLTHREVETIFHEFGHLLHHLLSRVEIRSLAGTNVAWDFVELPSQIMENWCWERAGAGPVRAPLRDRRAHPRRPVPQDEARAHLPRRQRADAAGGLRLHRSAAARALRRRARWRPDRLRAPPLAGIQPRPAARRTRHDRRLHAPVRRTGGLRRRLLLLQVGRGSGGRRLHALPRRRHFQPRDRRRVPRRHSVEGR